MADRFDMTTDARRLLKWLLLCGLLAALTVLGFRGYLSPDFLIGYTTSFMC
jgi:hypothetical protein